MPPYTVAMRAERYLKPPRSQEAEQEERWTVDTVRRYPEEILRYIKDYIFDLGVEVPGDPTDPDVAVSLCLTLNAACKFAGGNYALKPWCWVAAAQVGSEHWREWDSGNLGWVWYVASPMAPHHVAGAHDPYREIEYLVDAVGQDWPERESSWDGRWRQPWAPEIAQGWSKRVRRAARRMR